MANLSFGIMVYGILGQAANCRLVLHYRMAEKRLETPHYARRAEKAEEATS